MAANNQYVPPSKRPGGSWREDPAEKPVSDWSKKPLGAQLSDAYDVAGGALNKVGIGTLHRALSPVENAKQLASYYGPSIGKFLGQTGEDFMKARDKANGVAIPEDVPRSPSTSRLRENPLLTSGGTYQHPNGGNLPEDNTPVGVLEQPSPKEEKYVNKNNNEQVTPDPLTNPAAAIAARTNNKGVGQTGDGTKQETPEDKPVEPTPQQAAQAAVEEAGKSISEMNLNKPVWYESQSFNSALLSFGLNMLSGNSLAESFNAAGQMFDEQFAKETREGWRDQLLEAGYDPIEVQAYIDTGDNKALTDPMDKEAKRMAFRTNQIQLQNLEEANTPEAKAEQKKIEQRKREMEEEKHKSDILTGQINRQVSQGNLSLSQQRLAFDKQKHADDQAAKAAAAEQTKHDTKTMMGGMVTGGVTWDDVMEAGAYTPSVADIAKSKAINAAPEEMRDKLYQEYTPEFYKTRMTSNRVSEMLGRGLSGAALSETKERPTWVNALVPTADEIKRNDVEAIRRKQNTFVALQAYSESRADMKPGAGSIELRDIRDLNSGKAQFIVDPEASKAAGRPVPVGIRYADGTFKKL